MNIMKVVSSVTLATILASCAPKPYVVPVQDNKDYSLTCQQLASELYQAEQYKRAARADDRFMFRYMFPPTAFIAMYRFNKAEGNATKRMQYLEDLSGRKGCNQAGMIPPTSSQYQYGNQYLQPQEGSNSYAPPSPYGNQPYGSQPSEQPSPYGNQQYGSQPYAPPSPYGNQQYGSQPYAPPSPYGNQPYGSQPYAPPSYGSQNNGDNPYYPPQQQKTQNPIFAPNDTNDDMSGY